jgi:hypothetical protein
MHTILYCTHTILYTILCILYCTVHTLFCILYCVYYTVLYTHYSVYNTVYIILYCTHTIYCTFFSRHYCLPSHCNDYRGVRNRHTGEPGVANCEIVRGDGDEIWLVATRRIRPGPRGYAELLTFYGEDYEELEDV